MCMKMEEALVEHELHSAPKLFLMEDLDKEQRERVKVRISVTFLRILLFLLLNVYNSLY